MHTKMEDSSYTNENFHPDYMYELDVGVSNTDGSVDIVGQPQENGVSPQSQDIKPNRPSAQKQLLLMPKQQKIGRTVCVTLMYLCEVSSL